MPQDAGRAPAPGMFTVFTPAYNRAHTLHRTYESLKRQTCRAFEWLVVDDGSTDHTRDLLASWEAENLVPLRYFHQPHRGLHFAYNLAMRQARGEFLIKLDSDDACVPWALERLLFHWQQIPASHRTWFIGVTSLCQDQHGRLVGNRFPQDVIDCSTGEIHYRHRVWGEKWGFVRTDVLRRHPFPEDVTGDFVPESVVWSRIARQYQTRFVNDVLRVYWIDGPSLVHGRPSPQRNAMGHRLLFMTMLNHESSWLLAAPYRFVRGAANYIRFSLHARVSIRKQFAALTNHAARVLWCVAWPLGLPLYLRDRMRFG